MEKRTFTLDSSDGKSKLSGFLFLPEGHPRAVVQICHGMCEYILRYEELAQHLTDAGYAVCGIDHLGHGSTARLNNEMLGYFGEKGAWNNLVEDQEIERKAISAHFAGLPYSPQNCRILLRAIYYAAGMPEEMKHYYVTNVDTGAAHQRHRREEPRRRSRQGAGCLDFAVRRQEGDLQAAVYADHRQQQ